MRHRVYAQRAGILLFSAFSLVGCRGPQSTLDPAGEGASEIAALFWAMAAGAVIVWLGVAGLTVYAVRARKDIDRQKQASRLILAGAITPAVVLAALLAYGLQILPRMIAPAPEDSLQIAVTGERWWWRIRYEPPGSPSFNVANEIRLPVGEPVNFTLESTNVIHSFWIPSLGGKIDLIPGRVNRWMLRPTKTGTFRGVCAEFCGVGHAKMTFEAIVVSRAEFDQWVVQQSQSALAGGKR
jgi:cytochrome c oxidase subunit II